MAMDEAWWDKLEKDQASRGKSGKGYRPEGDLLGRFKPSCYEGHRPLVLGGTGLVVHGGSCSNPIVQDADVYIGFDSSMRFTERQYPWTAGHEVLYRITDYAAPREVAQFTELVSWTAEQLQAGAKVHCGCIGGHGRTGLFLSALVRHMVGIEDAVGYVREHYCKKAVESAEQIAYLFKHFGIKAVAGAKARIVAEPWPEKKTGSVVPISGSARMTRSGSAKAKTVRPVPDDGSVWGKRCN